MKTSDLAKKLAGCAENVCRHLFPKGEKIDNDWCLGDINGTPGKSLKISLSGESAGAWLDFAGNDSGNLITLWERAHGLDEDQACREAEEWLGVSSNERRTATHWEKIQKVMRLGSEAELSALAELRRLPSIAGLKLASDASQLYFAPVFDNDREYPAWIVTDSTRRNAQARRMDGQLWEKHHVKAKTLQGASASWPLGISDANGHDIALAEGGPDLLAAWHCLYLRGLVGKIYPVAMLGASNYIPDDALPLFTGKRVHILQHADDAGAAASTRWSDQLSQSTVQIEDLSGQKDLNDLVIACEGDEREVPAAIEKIFVPVGEMKPVEARVVLDDEDAPVTSYIPGVIKPNTQRLPSSFLLPPDDDSSVLLGNRYLNRGDGGILVGSSGMGKSSASLQMSVSWALGLPFMGIKSNGCLKILIIQSEDSDGDIAEVMLSMRHMLKLTPEQIAQVDSNIRIVCDRVNRGRAFIAALKQHVADFTPDLVIINPLQAFIDGDVTDSRDLGQFLREGLNGINDTKFGYILVHHTTKPATGRDKAERQWHEVMYDMAGGAELINWARFIISLRAARTNTVGEFDLVLAKRGRRAGVTQITGEAPFIKEEIVTTIPVKHATGSIPVEGRRRPVPVIFWEARTKSEEEIPTKKAPGGRPEKYPFANWATVFPAKSEPGLPVAQLLNRLRPNGAIGEKSIHGVLSRWMDHDCAIEFNLDANGVKLWRKSI